MEGALTPRDAVRPVAYILIAALAVAGCRREAAQRAGSSPYIVQVDLTSQIEGDVRKAYLDLQAVTAQVDVADRNRQVARDRVRTH